MSEVKVQPMRCLQNLEAVSAAFEKRGGVQNVNKRFTDMTKYQIILVDTIEKNGSTNIQL